MRLLGRRPASVKHDVQHAQVSQQLDQLEARLRAVDARVDVRRRLP